jgi:hypothetical protein
MSIIRCLEKVVMGLLGLAIVTFIFTVFTGPEKAIDNAFAVKLPPTSWRRVTSPH